jgi:hypothetical protein
MRIQSFINLGSVYVTFRVMVPNSNIQFFNKSFLHVTYLDNFILDIYVIKYCVFWDYFMNFVNRNILIYIRCNLGQLTNSYHQGFLDCLFWIIPPITPMCFAR